MALVSIQPPTEMSTWNFSAGLKAAGAYGCQPYQLRVLTVLKSGNLPPGTLKAHNRPG